MEGVVRLEARCDPEDVIANRLDPWHGVHLHPYSFAALTVLSSDDDVLKVRVAKRLVGRLCAETDATFHSPEPRTIVMTIVEGEGKGSVVETHATPIEPGRTAVVEATLATSDRKGFRHAVKLGRLIRPFIERSARRLWVDDAAYAERLSERRGGSAPGRP
jgi:isorenieratene synthase